MELVQSNLHLCLLCTTEQLKFKGLAQKAQQLGVVGLEPTTFYSDNQMHYTYV